jgi:glycosyltransferase involved in cell wall biosynthesis
MYSGNFGLAHDVDTFLEAARRLRDDDRFRFAFVGGGKRKSQVERFVEEHGLANCIVEEYQPRERLGELLSAADVHLVTMMPSWWGLVVPSKFFGVAAIGRPVVFVGPEQSEIARLIEEWECGCTCGVGDVDTLIREIERLVSDSSVRGKMGRQAGEMAACVSSRSDCIRQLFDAVCSGSGKSPTETTDTCVEVTR